MSKWLHGARGLWEVTMLADKCLWHAPSLFKYHVAYLKIVKKHLLGTFPYLDIMINITDNVCLCQRVGKWQKQKVILSVPVNWIIVEEMLKKTSHPELWEDDVLNTLLRGTAWRKCTSSNCSKQMRPGLSCTNFFSRLSSNICSTD